MHETLFTKNTINNTLIKPLNTKQVHDLKIQYLAIVEKVVTNDQNNSWSNLAKTQFTIKSK